MEDFLKELIFGYVAYGWLLLALGLLILELSAPGLFFFVAFAFGAVCAAIAAFLDFSVLIQLWVALLGGMASFFVIKIYFASHKIKNIDNKTNVDALIGQQGVVVEPIDIHLSGLIKIKGELWGAVLKDGSILQKGTLVRVVDIQGNKLVVRSIS